MGALPPLHNVLQGAAAREAKIKADAALRTQLDEVDRFGAVDFAAFHLGEAARDDLRLMLQECRERFEAALAVGRRTMGIERLMAKISSELFRRRLEGDDGPMGEDELVG